LLRKGIKDSIRRWDLNGDKWTYVLLVSYQPGLMVGVILQSILIFRKAIKPEDEKLLKKELNFIFLSSPFQ